MRPQFILAATAAFLPRTLGMNPEDVVGILSDTIVPNPELCQSLCQKDTKCFYSIYHFECDECWQMDCSGGMYVFGGTTDYTKLTTETIFYCDKTMLPTMPKNCSNLTATATVTSLDEPTKTGGGGSDSGNGSGSGSGEGGAGVRQVSWAILGAAVGMALAF